MYACIKWIKIILKLFKNLSVVINTGSFLKYFPHTLISQNIEWYDDSNWVSGIKLHYWLAALRNKLNFDFHMFDLIISFDNVN